MSEPSERPTLAGIGLIERQGRFLVRQRPAGTVYAGYWEFPGGKCEPGETPDQAVVRECLEETGLAVAVKRRRRVVLHRYPHGLVELSFFDCALVDPAAQPGDETGFAWVEAERLLNLRFPEANEQVVLELGRESRG